MITEAIIRLVTLASGLPALQGVLLPDKRVGATLRSLCLALSIDLSSQIKRLRRQPLFASALVPITLATAGGLQEVDVLLAWAIPLWVAGIQVSRLSAAKRARILIIQTQAVQALYQAFWDVAVPAEEAIEGEILSEDTLDARLEARLAAIEAALPDKAQLEARLAAIEATVRDLTGRVAADERLLAATIERLLWGQHSLMQMQHTLRALQEGQKQPERQQRGRRGRGRPRRGDSDKR